MKKLGLLTALIAVAMMMGMFMNNTEAYADISGGGTVLNPYQIKTAADLQNINNDVTAHYKLMANIDLSGIEFTPIGNADTGAFSGTFDGNGYTISNLTVDTGKYAGLFGYNEGEIKDVVLKNVEISGNRYVGGIVGYNSADGTINDCTVSSGEVKAEDRIEDLNIGGICGANFGLLDGKFDNKADILARAASSYDNNLGGILGYNNSELTIEGNNNGDVCFYSKLAGSSDYYGYGGIFCIGGIIGNNKANVTIINSKNTGDIFNQLVGGNGLYYYDDNYLGGIVGKSTENIKIESSGNNGDVSIAKWGDDAYAGGIIGYNDSTINISKSYNTGMVSSYSARDAYASGIAYAKNGTVTECFNSGIIESYHGWQSGGLSTKYYCYSYGVSNASTSDSYNTGYIISEDSDNDQSYGIIGTVNTYSVGNIVGESRSKKNTGKNHQGNYSLYEAIVFEPSYDYRLSTGSKASEMKNKVFYSSYDFDSIWQHSDDVNSGYPTLKSTNNSLEISECNMIFELGDTFNLHIISNDSLQHDIDWEVVYGNGRVTVDDTGKIKAMKTGVATITATDQYGNKANCNLVVIDSADAVSAEDISVHVSDSASKVYVRLKNDDFDYLINAESDDNSIYQIYGINSQYNYIYGAGRKSGETTVRFETVSGQKGQFTVTVTNEARKIELPSSITVARDGTRQLTATTSPSTTSSKITWSSSDESIVKVNSEGMLTGVSVGTATVTAKTDNGYSDTCSVTVNVPAESLQFKNPEVVIYKGDTAELEVVMDPADTTDTVSYSSYYSSYASCSNGSKTGVTVTGNKAGTTTITATASSGVKATCRVKVIDYPVIVTDVELNESTYDLKTGEMFKLSATITPSNATNKSVTWETTDETVATVNANGRVTGVGAGKALITATSENGIVAYCEVFVTGVTSKNTSKIYIPEILDSDEEYVDVPVMIENNPGINFASIKVVYDSSVMEPVSVSNGEIFGSVLGSIEKENSTVKLSFTSEENKTSDGTLAIIRYKVLKSSSEQTYPIKVCYYPGEIRNDNVQAVAFNIEDGVFTSQGGGVDVPTTDPDDPDNPDVPDSKSSVSRIFGAGRIDTSIKAADKLKEEFGVEKFENIVVATAYNFADTLPGSYVAAEKNAPILLIDGGDNYDKIISEYINKNMASNGTVYILGGIGVVPDKWLSTVKVGTVKRLGGDNRYKTNLAILRSVQVEKSDTVMVCTGMNFADSLSASATGNPILLADGNLTAEQKAYLDTIRGCDFCMIGGAGAVPESIANELAKYDRDGKVERAAGKSRFETSIAVAERFISDSNPDSAVLAYGYNYPDGLSGGPLAYATGAPLILTASNTASEYNAAKNYIGKESIKSGYILGGPDLISDNVIRTIFGIAGSIEIPRI